MAKLLTQHLHQPFVQRPMAVIDAQGLCVPNRFRALLPMNQMPGAEVDKGTAGHLAPIRSGVFVAQQWHDLRQAELFVKVGPANVHTAGGLNIGLALAL